MAGDNMGKEAGRITGPTDINSIISGQKMPRC